MAWPMQTTGQWGPGMGVTPDLSMGPYTPEQWAAYQQQNWQQWAQWQQQYASWQSQYGNKYAEQMQALQTMSTMPPLPPANAAPPPAPPPPDKPPPPPHENNQPLFVPSQSQPVSTSGQNNAQLNNVIDLTGSTQNKSYPKDVHSEATQSTTNTEALKNLAEEEKAFDIQFQKWEEEIDKWKKANINHPDKKAYEEYEQRFESCRARLLERRQQMKLKRAKLLDVGKSSQQSSNTNNLSRVNVPTTVGIPIHNVNSNISTVAKEQVNINYPPPNFNKNLSQNQPFNSLPPQNYNRDNNKNRYETYATTSNNSFTEKSNHSESFLPGNGLLQGIPGLDLVPEADKMANKSFEVVDITEDPQENPLRSVQQGPDYSKISKGIDNILCDEKIMNILSLVREQSNSDKNQNTYGSDTVNKANNFWDKNATFKDNYTGSTNNLMSQNDYSFNQENMGRQNLSHMKPQNEYLLNQENTGRHNMAQLKPQNDYLLNQEYPGRQNLINLKPQNEYSMNQENSQLSKYGTPPPRIFNNRPVGMPDLYNERNQQFNNQTVQPRSGMPNNAQSSIPIRSLLDPIENQNDYGRGYDRRGMQTDLQSPLNQSVTPNESVRPTPPVRPTWYDEPLFAPSIIVEYEHKPLRLKARDFIEPVHTFDYNHQSKDGDGKKKNYDKELDDLFRKNKIPEKENRYSDRYNSRDLYYRDHERSSFRENVRDSREDNFSRGIREEYDDRRRYESDIRDRRYEDRRRDDRDKFSRREDIYRERDRDREDIYRERDQDRNRDRDRQRDYERSKERDKDFLIGRNRDFFRDRNRDYGRSRSRDRDNRKRGLSKEHEQNDSSCSKKSKDTTHPLSNPTEKPKNTVIMIDDILELPGRQMRPDKIVIILRGPPGSGKSYLAKLIRDREAEHGGTVRVMSIDDYFMQEGEIEETDPTTGKIVKKPSLKYEYDAQSEESYIFSLKRAFRRSLTDGYFTFLIYDAVNEQLRCYADIWNFARQQGFQVYVCTMDLDPATCFKRNIHGRKLEDIEVICSRFFKTPEHHIQLDPTTLLQSASIPEVQMEDAGDDVTMAEDAQETEVNNSFTSKWEKMDDAAQLARLDGTSKPLRPSQLTMDDYLQLDEWKPNISKPGKKTVRWADIEERRQQEKMRAIGFVVGQTDWNRMTDPTMGSSALTQTKYIERVRRN